MKVDCNKKTGGEGGVKDQKIEFNLKVRYREWWNNRITKVDRYGTLFSERERGLRTGADENNSKGIVIHEVMIIST